MKKRRILNKTIIKLLSSPIDGDVEVGRELLMQKYPCIYSRKCRGAEPMG